MGYKLKIIFSDGSSYIDDRVFETEEDAMDEYDDCVSNLPAGQEALELSGEDYSDATIEDYEIWEV